MDDALFFRRRLAARILHAVGVSTAALPVVLPACSGGYGGPYGGGYGGAIVVPDTTPATTAPTATGSTGASSSGASLDAGATTSSSTSASASSGSAISSGGISCSSEGAPLTTQCFPWLSGTACPSTATAALAQFALLGCRQREPCAIESNAMPGSGECCYLVVLQLCGAGGRPFLVDDGSRVAPAVFGAAAGWAARASRPAVERLTPETRAELAAAWTADALAEHASVASFARVSLALLAVGAPAELVADTHRAALDEVRHAELCFALAGAYAGSPVGPGPFPVADALRVPTTLAELALATFAEGCVGETIAAAIAAEQLASASDPGVRAALSEIAADEARHAELAWRTVAWALSAGGSAVRAALAPAVLEALARACSSPERVPGGPDALGAHGRLDGGSLALATRRALREVIAPAAVALLAADALPSSLAPQALSS
jgi:hypothetical protein